MTTPQVIALLMPAFAFIFAWIMWLFVRRQDPHRHHKSDEHRPKPAQR
jgi:hypothetical protein